jgi:hypothetical protein
VLWHAPESDISAMATYQKNPFSGEEKANEKKKEN